MGEFSTLRFFVNPVRFGYFKQVLDRERALVPGKSRLLDVGCGGGVLAEEFARLGLEVVGVDPAPESILRRSWRWQFPFQGRPSPKSALWPLLEAHLNPKRTR